MAAAPKAAASPPSPAPPPPVPVSGITPQLRAKAPELTEAPKGQDPARELAQRQRDAIAKHTAEGRKALDDAAGEDAAPPPKAASASAKPSDTPAHSAKSSAASDKTTETVTEKEAKAPAADVEPAREQRYDLQSLRKWAEKNPDEAAEIGTKLFGMADDTRSEWIRLKNRERKLKEGINSERERTVAEARAEREAAEQAKAAIDGAATKLAPIADLWEAVAEKIAADPQNPNIDFDAADAAFLENAKISIDDYMRLRARRAIGGGPDAARLRAENARLKRELAGKPSEAIKPKAAADDPPEATPAAAEEQPKQGKQARDWSTEIDGKHKFRQIAGWNELLDAEMRRHHDPDLDEYSADPDEIADKLLKREIQRMMEEEAPADSVPTRTRARPAAATAQSNGKGKNGKEAVVPSAEELRPNLSTPGDDDEDAKVGGMTWSQRQSRALNRAMRRARGEIE